MSPSLVTSNDQLYEVVHEWKEVVVSVILSPVITSSSPATLTSASSNIISIFSWSYYSQKGLMKDDIQANFQDLNCGMRWFLRQLVICNVLSVNRTNICLAGICWLLNCFKNVILIIIITPEYTCTVWITTDHVEKCFLPGLKVYDVLSRWTEIVLIDFSFWLFQTDFSQSHDISSLFSVNTKQKLNFPRSSQTTLSFPHFNPNWSKSQVEGLRGQILRCDWLMITALAFWLVDWSGMMRAELGPRAIFLPRVFHQILQQTGLDESDPIISILINHHHNLIPGL